MSLGETLAPDGPRPASFLPAIKCSTCAIEIEISALADHVCSTQSTASALKSRIPNISNPFKSRQHDANEKSGQGKEEQKQTRARAQTLNKKPSRIALPKINSTAANQSYLSPRPRIEGLMASVTSRPTFSRGATSPMHRFFDPRPPSPELSANLDCAFPPFPPSKGSTSGRPSTSHGRLTPASDRAPSRSESRAASRSDQRNLTVEDPYSYQPKSARTNKGESVLQKLNTLKSGPFAAGKRQGSADTKESSTSAMIGRPSAADGRQPSNAASSLPRPSISRPTTPRPTTPRPTTPRPTTPAMEHDLTERSTPNKSPPRRPSRPSREIFSPTFLDRLSTEPAAESSDCEPVSGAHVAEHGSSIPTPATPRSARSGLPTLSKQQSEPALRSMQRRPSVANAQPSALPVPLRSQSRNGTRVDPRIQDAPPVPAPLMQHRKQSSSHAASESDASTISTSRSSNHTDHSYSTRPSPAGSIDALSPLAGAMSTSEDDDQLRPAGLNVRNPQKPGERAELPRQGSPPRAFARPAAAAATPAKREDFYALESPMDPAMFLYRAGTEHEPRDPSQQASPERALNPPRARTSVELPQLDTIIDRALHSVSLDPSPDAHDAASDTSSHYTSRVTTPEVVSPKNISPDTLQPPVIPQESRQRRQHARRPTINKPMCRGCGHLIEGKSVKAADGRLTGRWHKPCFVCRTCDAPFLTADFYVINNHPYCEHHYHEQNNSLCHGCNRGIEGQYLETTSSTRHGVVDRKYHPRCFTCSQCRVILTDDYFEINSRVYCERHALAAMRVQAHAAGVPGLYPTDQRSMMAERRTTRLINPMIA